MDMLAAITDARERALVQKRADDLAISPHQQGKALSGDLAGHRSVRAAGQRYRVIYEIIEDVVVVRVVGAGIRREGHKSDVYAQTARALRRRHDNPST